MLAAPRTMSLQSSAVCYSEVMAIHQLHTQHSRNFAENRFVYPVLSRRSGGISIGVNLNPDKICNFDCIYCQVDRTTQSETRFVEFEQLLQELSDMLQFCVSGEIFETDQFKETPAHLRRLCDIAFSGDGEPTTYRNFDELMRRCAEIKRLHDPAGNVKMVLITNASMFHRETVQRGLEVLDANQGEIWAKLEAGTEDYFRLVDRTPIRFEQILNNITSVSQVRSIVIQSLFMNVHGEPPTPAELQAFCDRLNEIQSAGGQIRLVQIYTIARRTTESFVSPLADDAVDAITKLVIDQTGLSAESFYGAAG